MHSPKQTVCGSGKPKAVWVLKGRRKYVDKKTGTQVNRVYLSTYILLQAFRNQRREISRAAGITPFVVIPSHDLDQISDDKRIH